MYCGVPMIVPASVAPLASGRQRADGAARNAHRRRSAWTLDVAVFPMTFASPQSMTSTTPKSSEHDVLRLEVAVDHALAVGEGDGVAHFLENGEQRGQRIFLHRLRHAFGEQFEHFAQRDAAHHFHGVKGLAVFIDAQLVDGDDVRVLELAGDLGLGDEAREIIRAGAIEHHLHGHAALDGRLLGIEDRAHAALRDDLRRCRIFSRAETPPAGAAARRPCAARARHPAAARS